MNPFRNIKLVGVLLVLTAGAVSLVGCGKSNRPASDSTENTSQSNTPAEPSGPQIAAEPNPVPAGSGDGKTTITWTAGPGNTGEVYVVVGNGSEKLFAGNVAKGRQEAPFINAAGPAYEFRLYEGKAHKKLLSSVKVTREKGSQLQTRQ